MEARREIEKIGSVGRALPHVEVDIRDPDGKPLPPGRAGEICLRGAKITQGYWRDAKKTAASFYGDWFRTGDVTAIWTTMDSVSHRPREGHDHFRR